VPWFHALASRQGGRLGHCERPVHSGTLAADKASADFFAGKTISLGGVFTYGKSLAEFAAMMKEIGATVVKPSASVDYHVIGRDNEKAEASEAARAKTLGVAAIGERFARECWALWTSRGERAAATKKEAARPAARSTPKATRDKHVARLTRAHGKLPARLEQFLTREELAAGARIDLADGHVQGVLDVDFWAEELADREELGEAAGVDDFADVEWDKTLVPLALIADEGEAIGAFLVVDASDPACPVLLWHRDGWKLYPLSPSLDAFVAGKAGKGGKGRASLGQAYRRFGWR
jgi:hypothetical protein